MILWNDVMFPLTLVFSLVYFYFIILHVLVASPNLISKTKHKNKQTIFDIHKTFTM